MVMNIGDLVLIGAGDHALVDVVIHPDLVLKQKIVGQIAFIRESEKNNQNILLLVPKGFGNKHSNKYFSGSYKGQHNFWWIRKEDILEKVNDWSRNEESY